MGLEFKLNDIFKIKYGFIALSGVIFPWIGGFFLAKLFGYGFGSAVFVGTALTATSIAITANVLKEMGKLKTDWAKAIIGAAVIDDVLGLLVLSISKQTVSGIFSFASVSFILIKTLLFLAAASYAGIKFLKPMVEQVDKSKLAGKFPEFAFIFAMTIAFLYAMLAELTGLSAIVGSFIAGMVLEGAILKRSRNYREGAEYLHIIFASIFFVSLGILVDVHTLKPEILWFLIALTIVAVITKFFGCYIAAKLQGFSHKDSSAIGWGMSPRGEVAMIVALIGLDAGIIKQDIYVSLVFMSLLTTILTPVILRNWVFRSQSIKT